VSHDSNVIPESWIALFLTARLRLCFGDDVDDFIRHRIYQNDLIFHFRILVVGKFGDLLGQFRRKAIRLDRFWQAGTDFWGRSKDSFTSKPPHTVGVISLKVSRRIAYGYDLRP
jgi:hypothetical protein